MFYLKYVLLEMTQEGQEKAGYMGIKESACEFREPAWERRNPACEHRVSEWEHQKPAWEQQEPAWECQEPWESWISSLREAGIRVRMKPLREAGIQMPTKPEDLNEAGIHVLTDPESLESRRACLWITDDAKRAEAYARKGMPVMGVLQEKDSEAQSFDAVSFLVSDLTEVEPDYLEKVYRRQVGIPWEIARTKRCVIRESVAEDAKAFYEIYKDPTVTEFMEDLPKDPDAFAAWLEDYTKHVYSLLEYGIWTICLNPDRNEKRLLDSSCESVGDVDRGLIKDGEQIIGRAGLTVREGYDAPELGFVIGKPWRGQGLALEVCEAVLEYAKELEIPEVIAFAEAGNAASFGLLHKLGFQEMREVLLDGRTCCMFRKAL